MNSLNLIPREPAVCHLPGVNGAWALLISLPWLRAITLYPAMPTAPPPADCEIVTCHNLRWEFRENSQIMNKSWFFLTNHESVLCPDFKDCEMQVSWFCSGGIWFITLLLTFLPVEARMKSDLRILGDDICILTHCENIYKLPRWDFSWLGKSKNSFPSRPAVSSSKLLLF